MSVHLVKLLRLASWHQLMKFLFLFFGEKILRKFDPLLPTHWHIPNSVAHASMPHPLPQHVPLLPHGACNHKISSSFCLEFHVNYKWIEWIKRMPNIDSDVNSDACVSIKSNLLWIIYLWRFATLTTLLNLIRAFSPKFVGNRKERHIKLHMWKLVMDSYGYQCLIK